VRDAPASWQPPGVDELKGRLLDEEHAYVRHAVCELTRGQARTGLVLVGDGATNTNREPVLNVLSVRGGRVEFIKAMNCKGKTKDKAFIADDFIAVINAQPDPHDVVMVITDNACRASWPLIETACPWVVCGACHPHVCDLLLEDIGKLEFFKAVFSEAHLLRSVVRSRGFAQAAYNSRCKTKLVLPGDTRFNTNVLGASNLLRNRDALVGTMGDAAVIAGFNKVKNDKLEGAFGTVGAQFAHVQAQVMDADFWARLGWAKHIMTPIGRLLRYTEQDAPTASKVHHAWFLVQSAIEEMDMNEEVKAEVLRLVRARWDYGYNCVIGAGYVLDPEFRLCEPDEETTASFDAFVLKCYPPPAAPGADATDAAKEEYAAAKEKHAELLLEIDLQLLAYRRGDGVWGREKVMLAASRVSAVDFWDLYGTHVPELQRVALRALGCVAGACSAERAHKFMAHTLTDDRNRLAWGKVEKMIYVQMNLPLAFPDINASSSVDAAFVLDEDEEAEAPPLPSVWRDDADAADDSEAAAAVAAAAAAAETRASCRAATMAARKEAAAKGRPSRVEQRQEREEGGRRGTKRPAHFDDFV
jgi:Protein of unknown function (DUF 659)/hAT family C-terminal dimerisation region